MKIAILQKSQESAVSYYRVTPMYELARQYGHTIQDFQPKYFTFEQAHKFDVLFCHRPGSEDEILAIANAKTAGCAVWVDIDDLLWSIPIANHALQHYNPHAHETLHKAFHNADIITCSTQELADAVETEFAQHAHVVQNGWNDRPGSDYIRPYQQGEKYKVLYRGSNTHQGDLYTFRDAFRQYENIDFQWFGATPWMMQRTYGGHLDKLHINTWTSSLRNYFSTIYQMGAQFFVFPLENNQFNRCKSNIAWIEATQAGAVAIVPKYMPEFADVPGIHFDHVDDLVSVFMDISNDPTDNSGHFAKLHESAVEHLKREYRLSQINKTRQQLINEL
jgi:hypothetical protein